MSGPIRQLAEPPQPSARAPGPVASFTPPAARPPAARPAAPSHPPPVSIFSARSSAPERSARERAVELFDRGVALRGAGRYGEALDAWEKALALAPDNRIYQANVQRLRGDLGRLRAETSGKLGDFTALCASLALGIVETSIVDESNLRVVVRACAGCAGVAPAGQAMCHHERGLVGGAIAAIFKRPARVRETACIGGCGDEACRFDVEFT
jgi:predicted hydrocarbon binding protein